jgi:tetratricopeptide (TPR) repeat protein
MIKKFLIFSVLICCSFPVVAQRNLPQNAEHLRDYLNDESGMVNAARQYQLQQMNLAQWDYEIGKSNEGSSDTGLKDSPGEMMEKRNTAIRLVWEYTLSVFPNNARAMNYFGEYWYDLGGNMNTAILLWTRAIAVDRNMSFAHNNLGLHHFHTGNVLTGLMHIDKAVELDPKNPDFLFNITQMYLNHFPEIMKIKKLNKKSLYRASMKYSENATRYAPDDFALAQDYAVNFYAGENFDVDVNWDKAIVAWQSTLALAKSDEHRFYSLLNEGRCWLKVNNNAKAKELFEAALVMRPDSIAVQDLVAKASLPSTKN